MPSRRIPAVPRRAQVREHASRQCRAREIVAAHAREIAESAVGAVYKVPGSPGVYVVSLSRGICECADFAHRAQPCKHLLAAEIVSSKSRTCCDCGGRFLGRDLVEVEDGHLTWFQGDELCRRCALAWGVL